VNDERTPLEHAQDGAIRRWLDAAPERASERAVNATIDALRETDQPRRIVVSMSLPLAAAVALLMVVVIGGLALRGLGPLPAASPSPTPAPSGACSLEQLVGGRHSFFVGSGFAPDADVTLEIDRANGAHLTVGPSAIASLHTDPAGRFGVELLAFSEDVGTGRLTAVAGCSASLSYVVTAEQVGPPCVDPAAAQPLMDTAAYRSAVAADAPIDWWHLDEQSGPLAADAIGAASGSWQGALRAVLGSSGSGALYLPGDGGSYVAVTGITLMGEFTVEAWVLLCDYVDNQDAIVGNADTSPNINFHDARIRLFVGAEGDDVVVATTAATIGAWEHWAITRNAQGLTRIYRNGVLDATGTIWTGEMIVNEIGRGDAGSLRGAIDELAIYNVALTEEQLSAHVLAR
jgi:hypothetical protein